MSEIYPDTSEAPKRILVFGATGTIGRATVRALAERGYDVTCFARTGAQRCALASKPGSNRFSPWARARSRSSVPSTRSSVEPNGKSTNGTGILWALSDVQRSGHSSRASGAQLNRQPSTTDMGGSVAARARAAVDFPVPRSPKIITPLIRASTAAISNASFISS